MILHSLYFSWIDSCRRSSIRLGINMPARVEKTVRRGDETQLIGEPTGEFYEVVLFFGIIDILQDYDISKKLEHAYKSFQFDPTSISAVDPKQYSKRFRDFIFRAFTEDTWRYRFSQNLSHAAGECPCTVELQQWRKLLPAKGTQFGHWHGLCRVVCGPARVTNFGNSALYSPPPFFMIFLFIVTDISYVLVKV